MKSRSLITVAGATALLLALAGCSGGDSGSSGGAKLEVQTGQAVDSTILAELKTITKKFEASHPDVDIDLRGSTANYESDIKVRLASGNVPDIWWTHGWSLQRYGKFLTPLQDEAWAKDFNPALDSAMKNDKGQFFAFPVDTDVAGILYNKTVLSDAGIDPASLTTWDAFEAAARTLKDAGITPIMSSGKAAGPAGNLADWISPGAYTKSQLADLTDGKFDEAHYSKVLDLVASWKKDGFFNEDYVSATGEDMAKALGTGKAAFIFQQNNTANQALTYNPEAELGYMPVPSLTGDTPYLIGGEMNAFGISKTTKDMKGAKEFIAFLAEPENAAALAKSAGSIPGLTNVKADLGVLQSSYDSVVEPGAFPLVPYFDRVYLPNGMWNTMVTTTDSVITGGSGSVKPAVSTMAKDFDRLFGQNK